MRSEAPVDRSCRWTTWFGVGLLLVVVLGVLTGTMAVAVTQERVAAYDYDGLSAPAWPDGGSAFAETSPIGPGVGAAVHAYAYDLPVAALVDVGRAHLPGHALPHALGGEDDTAAPVAEVAGASTTRLLLTSTPRTAAGGARVSHLGDDVARQVDDAIERAAQGKIRFPGHDGKVFDNTDGLLPPSRPGYYSEWTAAASGAKRGAHRVIVGGNPASPDVIYYWDHAGNYVQVWP